MGRLEAIRGAIRDAKESYTLRKEGKEPHLSTGKMIPVYRLGPCLLDIPEYIVLSYFPGIEKKVRPVFKDIPAEQASPDGRQTAAERLRFFSGLLRPVLPEKEFHFSMQRLIRRQRLAKQHQLLQDKLERLREKRLQDLDNWYWARVYNEMRNLLE